MRLELIYVLKQPVERKYDRQPNDADDDIARHSEPEKHLVDADVLGGRDRITRNDDLAGDVEQSEDASDDREEVQEPSDPSISVAHARATDRATDCFGNPCPVATL